jgi:hypothetical protein
MISAAGRRRQVTRAAALVTALGLSLSAATVQLAPAGHSQRQPATPTSVERPAQQTAGTGAREPRRAPLREGGGRQVPRAERLEVRRKARPVAWRFLRAYLRYERGTLGPNTRRSLRSSADSELARTLLADPARVPLTVRRPPNTRVRRLRLLVIKPGAVKALVTLARGGRIQPLELTMRRHEERWRVVGLG